MYKKILLPVDGSKNATLACNHAIAFAKSDGMEIVLLCCYEIRSARIGATKAKSEIVATLEDESKKILAPCEALCAADGVKYKTMIEHGRPADTIIRIAEEEDCDLIVMGSRGLGNLASAVMGSVTTKVLKGASVPVLVVRQKKKKTV